MKYNYFRTALLIVNSVIVACEFGFLSFVKGLGDYKHIYTGLLSVRTYALYNQSKRLTWFLIFCATILSGVACVGPVLDPVCRVLRESFQWITFWFKDRDEVHTLSITGKCYNAIPVHGCVHFARSFSNQLN